MAHILHMHQMLDAAWFVLYCQVRLSVDCPCRLFAPTVLPPLPKCPGPVLRYTTG